VVVAKWALAGLLILPQSILLGATFPLMSAGALRRVPGSPGRTLSLLYFSNSLGAAAGVLIAGFVLFDLAGLPGTLAAAGFETRAVRVHSEPRGEVNRPLYLTAIAAPAMSEATPPQLRFDPPNPWLERVKRAYISKRGAWPCRRAGLFIAAEKPVSRLILQSPFTSTADIGAMKKSRLLNCQSVVAVSDRAASIGSRLESARR